MPPSWPSVQGAVARLGNRDVHWVHQAGRRPPVILTGGCGVPYYCWDDVVRLMPDVELARLDRPGLVATPWPGVLPRLADEVATLADLVRELGGPAIVVGHSMAGLHAEALARLHPELVAGLVLADSSVERRAKPPGSGRVWLQVAHGVRAAMRVPPLRPAGSFVDRILVAAQSQRRGIFDPVQPIAKEVYRSPDATASVIAEQAAYGQQVFDLAELRRTASFPDIEVTVLTAAGVGAEGWLQVQRRLAQLLGGRHVVVEDSGHLIMIDRPDAVSAAVREVRGTGEKAAGK